MPKTYESHIKEQAKTLMVMMNMRSEEISAILKPSATTIDRWAEEGDWGRLQELRNGSTLKLGLEAINQINMIMMQAREEDRTMSAKEVDQCAKLRKLMEGLNRELGYVSNAIEVMGKFMEYVRDKDEDLFKALTEYSMDFTSNLYKELGDG
jgi:division protein CdvB (Snf7/Vps24/ESCRT-III family)